MAKRRILKRDISDVAGDLFSEALFCKLYLPGVNSEKADVVMARVLDMQDEFIRRANVRTERKQETGERILL